MSIKVPSFWQPKNHQILLYDKKTRCRDVVCREGMLVQVGTRAAVIRGLASRHELHIQYYSGLVFSCTRVCAWLAVRVVCV